MKLRSLGVAVSMTIKGYVNDGHFVMKRSSVNNYVNDLGYEIVYKGSYLLWQSLNPKKYPDFEYPKNIIDVLKLNDHAHDWYREDLIKKIGLVK